MATLTFQAVAEGTTDILLLTDNQEDEGFLLDVPPPGNQVFLPDFVQGSITVIPEPATLALLAFGGLALIRRR